jgi:hypothetical protein
MLKRSRQLFRTSTWYTCIAAVVSLVLVGWLNVFFHSSIMAPVLNDVATDLNKPPEFVSKANLNPLPPSFKSKTYDFPPYREQLQALSVDGTLAPVFEACKRSCSHMPGWKLTNVDAQRGIIEGFATTLLMRFKDDFVIRLQENAGKTRIDMYARADRTGHDFAPFPSFGLWPAESYSRA